MPHWRELNRTERRIQLKRIIRILVNIFFYDLILSGIHTKSNRECDEIELETAFSCWHWPRWGNRCQCFYWHDFLICFVRLLFMGTLPWINNRENLINLSWNDSMTEIVLNKLEICVCLFACLFPTSHLVIHSKLSFQ